MSTTTQAYVGTLEVTSCCECGIHFGVPSGWLQERRERKDGFRCPNGHSLVFRGPTEAERLRGELARKTAELDQRSAEFRDFAGAMDAEQREATDTARRWYRHDKPRRGSFWKGFDARKCGCGPEACPYPTARGGYRRAWFRGYGEEDPGPHGGRLLLPAPKVIEADYEVLP